MGIGQALTLTVVPSLANSEIVVQVGEMPELPKKLEHPHFLRAPPMFIRMKLSGPNLVGFLYVSRRRSLSEVKKIETIPLGV